MLDLLAESDTPAVVSNLLGRIVFWNAAAERLLGHAAEDTLGRPCHEVVGGRDGFGNRFCSESCPVAEMARRGERVRPFELVVRSSSGQELPTYASILTVPGDRTEDRALVHLLEPLDREGGLSRALAALATPTAQPGRQGGPPHPPYREWGEPPLTPREKRVLELVARGLQNKEIAPELRISLATVRNHVHNILEKLDVHSKLEAVSLAFRRHWVE